MIAERVKDLEALRKVKVALREILLRLPLIGLTLYGRAIRVRERLGSGTMATDGKTIWYNPRWVLKHDPRIVVFGLVHEWLHIFGNDVLRGQGRVWPIWQKAIDDWVNRETKRLLKMEVPAGCIQPAYWSGDLSKEQIYDRLLKEHTDKPPESKPPPEEPPDEEDEDGLTASDDEDSDDKDSADGGIDGDPEEEGAEEDGDSDPWFTDDLDTSINEDGGLERPEHDEEFLSAFQDDIAQARTSLERAGEDLATKYGPGITSRMQDILKGTLPWGRLVRGRLVGQLGGSRENWSPPNLRYWPDQILPKWKSTQEPILVIGVDVSASVDRHSFNKFADNVAPAAARAKKVAVVVFDDRVREVVVTNRPATILRNLRFMTGSHSHTDARGVFQIAEEMKASAIVVETDGFVQLPSRPFPETTWVLNAESNAVMPWGVTYKMERSW